MSEITHTGILNDLCVVLENELSGNDESTKVEYKEYEEWVFSKEVFTCEISIDGMTIFKESYIVTDEDQPIEELRRVLPKIVMSNILIYGVISARKDLKSAKEKHRQFLQSQNKGE